MGYQIILSTAYLAPIQYFTKFLIPADIVIEKHENFIKQTYRNRCIIYGANGTIPLTVPVKRGSFHKTLINELEIDYSKKWQKLHWKAIESAYLSAPFFEYYYDELKPFYQTKTRLLIDLNTNLLEILLKFTGIKAKYSFTKQYTTLQEGDDAIDYRNVIHPKHPLADPFYQPQPYYQVFEERHGFLENLSILDLLFNTGPETYNNLQKAIIKD